MPASLGPRQSPRPPSPGPPRARAAGRDRARPARPEPGDRLSGPARPGEALRAAGAAAVTVPCKVSSAQLPGTAGGGAVAAGALQRPACSALESSTCGRPGPAAAAATGFATAENPSRSPQRGPRRAGSHSPPAATAQGRGPAASQQGTLRGAQRWRGRPALPRTTRRTSTPSVPAGPKLWRRRGRTGPNLPPKWRATRRQAWSLTSRSSVAARLTGPTVNSA